VPFVDSDGVRLAVEVLGSEDPVTLVAHGITQDRTIFAIPAQFVPGTKVLFDFRGHGESERPPPGQYSFDHFAADVKNVADAYGATRLVGNSLGGGSTLRLLESEPNRFERLVFILPARLESSDEALRGLLRLADLLEKHPVEEAAQIMVSEEDARGEFRNEGEREVRRRGILSMNREGIPNAIKELVKEHAVRDANKIRALQTPALIIGQEGDEVHKAAVARELADALPNSELVMLPSPTAWMESLPVLVQKVAAFLAA
jgi:3-oxoadipate enol-lactonase